MPRGCGEVQGERGWTKQNDEPLSIVTAHQVNVHFSDLLSDACVGAGGDGEGEGSNRDLQEPTRTRDRTVKDVSIFALTAKLPWPACVESVDHAIDSRLRDSIN